MSRNLDMDEGGMSIAYRDEDPFIREEYRRMLELEEVEFSMPAEAFV